MVFGQLADGGVENAIASSGASAGMDNSEGESFNHFSTAAPSSSRSSDDICA